MKIVLTLILNLFFLFSHCQDKYSIRVFDKNTRKNIDSYNFKQYNDSLEIVYGNKKIVFDVSKRELDEKYLDIFLDTLNNSCNCWVLVDIDKPNTAGSIRYKGEKCCFPSHHFSSPNYHVIRNLGYYDKNPRNGFNFGDFFSFYQDLYLGSNFGVEYSGVAVGISLRYLGSTSGGYGFALFHIDYSRLMNGKFTNGNTYEFGARFLPLPLGLSLSALEYEDQFSLNLKPEIGVDLGLFSIVYGYNFKIIDNNSLKAGNMHYFKIALAINVSKPIRNFRTKFPYESLK